MTITCESDLAGAFRGERIFLIGNGPSLAETPLDELEGEYTMAMNKIDLIYNEVAWRPNFYLAAHRNKTPFPDLKRSIQVHEDINSTHLFLAAELRGLVSAPAVDVTFLNVNYMQDYRQENPMNTDTSKLRTANISWLKQYWSYDILEEVWAFHSMYVAAQLSLWMGFDKIYFIGTDLGFTAPIHMPFKNGIDPMSYKGQKLKYLKTAIQEKKLLSAIVNGLNVKLLPYIRAVGAVDWIFGPDNNHFDPLYRGQTIYSNANKELRGSHIVIRRICESADVKVRNATLGGELDVYPRVDLLEILRY